MADSSRAGLSCTQVDTPSCKTLPQTKLLDAGAAPKVDIAGHSPKAIMQRAGLGPPTTEDLYQDARAREVGTPPCTVRQALSVHRPPVQATRTGGRLRAAANVTTFCA
jgi:hypothetical protein